VIAFGQNGDWRWVGLVATKSGGSTTVDSFGRKSIVTYESRGHYPAFVTMGARNLRVELAGKAGGRK
jgi:hypothetical protein